MVLFLALFFFLFLKSIYNPFVFNVRLCFRNIKTKLKTKRNDKKRIPEREFPLELLVLCRLDCIGCCCCCCTLVDQIKFAHFA